MAEPKKSVELPGVPETAAERAADPDLAKLENWFTYHAPTPPQVDAYGIIRETAKELARVIVNECPPSADRTAALRKLREAVFTANASIACGGK